MDSGRNPRCDAEEELARSKSPHFAGHHGAGPGVLGLGKLDFGTGGIAGSSSTLLFVPGSEASRSLGADGQPFDGRQVERSADVEDQRQGLVHRGEEETGQCKGRRQRRSSCNFPGGEAKPERSSEERRKGRSEEQEGERGGGRRGGSLRRKKEVAADAAVKTPEPGASTVHATRIWDFAFSLLGRLKTKMSLAFHSARNRPSEEKALRGVVWPCPLPFPEMHRRRSNRKQKDTARKLAINFTIVALNMFHNGRRHFARAIPSLGTKLNLEQWNFVKSLGPMVDEWNLHAPVTPEMMGRAAKFESVEGLLHHLQEESFPIAAELRSYGGRLSSDSRLHGGI